MKRETRHETMKALTADELRHVIGGTQDPSRPIGDPGVGTGGGSSDLDAIGQNFNRQG